MPLACARVRADSVEGCPGVWRFGGLSFDHKLFKPNYRLNFNFHAGDRKFAYANERTRGSCSPKKFLANEIYLGPVRDVRKIHGHLQYLVECGSCGLKN